MGADSNLRHWIIEPPNYLPPIKMLIHRAGLNRGVPMG